ncbi:MAG: hypothetical protein IJ640_06340 [Prevotella sp.]|nr:hypothetical protein [Prevotella sp.]MBR1526262.1 hypothetical protein [Prevotella sp.]
MNILKSIKYRYETFVLNSKWDFLIWEKTKARYHRETGKQLNYNNPQDINEKLHWLNRYWRNPLKTLCTDKYLVREYVGVDKQLSHILVPLITVYDRVEDIDFNVLPQQFVLKCNHGSGFNIICTDKTNFDVDMAKKRLNQWMSTDFSKRFGEIHYRYIKRKIICEHLIGNSAPPIEYQVWCINGEPDSFLVCRKNFDGTYDARSYSLDWTPLFERKGETDKFNVADSPLKDSILKYARTLSEPFPFVRADFYVVNEKIYFAELTFTPAGNLLSNYNDVFLNRLGKNLRLPRKSMF